LQTKNEPGPEPRNRSQNILFAIAMTNPSLMLPLMDQWYKNPFFYKVAQDGIFFTNAFVCTPQCSPSRACNPNWKKYFGKLKKQVHNASYFSEKISCGLRNLLASVVIRMGFTGKPWGQVNWKKSRLATKTLWDRSSMIKDEFIVQQNWYHRRITFGNL